MPIVCKVVMVDAMATSYIIKDMEKILNPHDSFQSKNHFIDCWDLE